MRAIKLLSFYLLFSLSFTVFADKNYIHPDFLEVSKLCTDSQFCKGDYICIASCMTRYMNSDELILGEQEMIRSCGLHILETPLEISKCLDIKAKYSQKLLEQVEAQMLDAVLRWDEWTSFVWDGVIDFSESSKAFILYRDMQCKFSASLSGASYVDNGLAITGQTDQRSQIIPACIAVQNNQRIQKLREYIPSLELKEEEKLSFQ